MPVIYLTGAPSVGKSTTAARVAETLGGAVLSYGAHFDIELDGVSLRWNSSETDWIAKPGSLHEVGSIHTVQGYDLNYAGVIIGPDLRFDPITQSLFVDRESYKDAKGKEGNKVLEKVYDDNDLRRFITNIYAVLMTRGMRGTYLYVCDPSLREHLRKYIPTA